MGAGIPSLPPPVFVNDADGLDPNLILADMIAEFEAASGRTLQPAQVERLLINLYAYRESLVRNAIQYAAEQNLLAFASFPMLDYLGQLLSVTRLASQPAVTTLQFTLTGALTVPFTIPAERWQAPATGNLHSRPVRRSSSRPAQLSRVSLPRRPLQERVRMDTWRDRSMSS